MGVKGMHTALLRIYALDQDLTDKKKQTIFCDAITCLTAETQTVSEKGPKLKATSALSAHLTAFVTLQTTKVAFLGLMT